MIVFFSNLWGIYSEFSTVTNYLKVFYHEFKNLRIRKLMKRI